MNAIITLTTGAYVNWVFVLFGIVVGLMVAQGIINR